jgi:hypothetical protein
MKNMTHTTEAAMNVKKMTVFLNGGVWMVHDNAPEVAELFGTDILPTPFTSLTPASEVLAELKKRNPDYIVEVK